MAIVMLRLVWPLPDMRVTEAGRTAAEHWLGVRLALRAGRRMREPDDVRLGYEVALGTVRSPFAGVDLGAAETRSSARRTGWSGCVTRGGSACAVRRRAGG